MKKSITILSSIIFFAGCSISKKTTVNEQSKPSSKNTKPSNGIYEPDSAALNAIQLKYPDVSLKKLQEGYIIYAYGPCVNCHSSKNIYQYDEIKWKSILNEMAVAANISVEQKDAVYKYVLSIKATQTN